MPLVSVQDVLAGVLLVALLRNQVNGRHIHRSAAEVASKNMLNERVRA